MSVPRAYLSARRWLHAVRKPPSVQCSSLHTSVVSAFPRRIPVGSSAPAASSDGPSEADVLTNDHPPTDGGPQSGKAEGVRKWDYLFQSNESFKQSRERNSGELSYSTPMGMVTLDRDVGRPEMEDSFERERWSKGARIRDRDLDEFRMKDRRVTKQERHRTGFDAHSFTDNSFHANTLPGGGRMKPRSNRIEMNAIDEQYFGGVNELHGDYRKPNRAWEGNARNSNRPKFRESDFEENYRRESSQRDYLSRERELERYREDFKKGRNERNNLRRKESRERWKQVRAEQLKIAADIDVENVLNEPQRLPAFFRTVPEEADTMEDEQESVEFDFDQPPQLLVQGRKMHSETWIQNQPRDTSVSEDDVASHVASTTPLMEKDDDLADSALEYARLLREDAEKTMDTMESDLPWKARIRRLLNDMPHFERMAPEDILFLLRQSIVYNREDDFRFLNLLSYADDVVCISKPYGLACQGAEISLVHFLPELAKIVECEQLHLVHRLDATTSGCLVLAKTPEMAEILSSAFKLRKVVKIYWCITKAVPNRNEGIINIPISSTKVEGKYVQVLKPIDLPDGTRVGSKSLRRAEFARTHYKTISSDMNAALLEVQPEGGVKHQIRVHLGHGLRCPILGDHKYSIPGKLAPQVSSSPIQCPVASVRCKLPNDILTKLKITNPKARYLPLYIHARSLLFPDALNGKSLYLYTYPPNYFKRMISTLHLDRHFAKRKGASKELRLDYETYAGLKFG
ncbi:unnamed protein product [Cyprideis torosa]|uniref:Pseudouridylate synthase RPUSD4, mitochondrial n=1 Tax=Cyprideis torosa TaxID=163714 RepID=A0A7R8WGP3_9CRUS|nr:unnamed protein product [Cyprideis torosa]CAG0892849.1 unnamed protein product [Cyprideis torosa]